MNSWCSLFISFSISSNGFQQNPSETESNVWTYQVYYMGLCILWSSRSMFKVRRGGHEEISLVQGKRNPSKTVSVARGHQRADTLKPHSQKTSQSNHTRTTALPN